MTDYNHKQTMDEIVNAFKLTNMVLEHMDADTLKQAMTTLNKTHAIGPIVDPTAYMAALSDNRIEHSADLVEWVQQTKKLFAKLRPDANKGD